METKTQNSTMKTRLGCLSLATTGCIALLLAPATFAGSPFPGLADEFAAEEVEAGALSGTWALNKKLSDDPGGVGPGRRGGRGRGPGRSPDGGFGGGPGGGSGPGGGPGARSRPANSGNAGGRGGGENQPKKLEIVHGPDEIVVIDGLGRERSYSTDGRETAVEGPRGEQVVESAEWTGAALVVTTVDPRGESTETFRLNADGQLEVLHERAASGDRPAIALRTVYDPTENPSR